VDGLAPPLEPAIIVGSGVLPPGVVTAIQKVFAGGLEGVVLFGSLARGDVWLNSDADLLLVLNEQATVSRGLYELWDERLEPCFRDLPRRIAPHFARLPAAGGQAGSIWLEAALDGVVLVDPRLKVSGTLRELRGEILAGRVVRRTMHGRPYWIHAEPGEAA